MSGWTPKGSNQVIRGLLSQARAQRSFVRGCNLKEKNAALALIMGFSLHRRGLRLPACPDDGV